MLKDGNKDVNQDVPDNLYDMLVTKFLPQKMDEQVSLEIDAEENVHEIRRTVGGKKIHLNIVVAPLDNVLFHSKTSVQKWKYIFPRRIFYGKEIGINALDCKEIIDLIKVTGLMKTVTDIGP